MDAENPKVVSVFLSQSHKLHTTRSWGFLGQEKNGRVRADSAWVKGKFGQNVIIGSLDTGKITNYTHTHTHIYSVCVCV